ncbi:MAG: hypothetical protein HOA33_12875 [Gammaproteobacteria bacterium]|jgi:hypothetical protein|nr:hypothetical protein [Gammaproteobacteria bacterium]MBT4257338.1 hypothetical protein [Gammaproteobacteria bacterium]MBT4659746.1 hypothetical protein [Gammaproteobacteria bacterium]MBT4892843.1 hypothetical protein [Gammaproteobacteria bacterium]MBT5512260.1 hypothetical protein [Gammaproteobacteria bacterium]
MRELTNEEIDVVSGAGTIGEWAADGAGVGTIGGAIITGGIRGAMMGGAYGGLLGATAGAGYVAGTYLYDVIS